MIQKHQEYTGSTVAKRLLDNWDEGVPKFVKVIPHDFKRMMQAFAEVEAQGLSGDEAAMAAFELNKNDASRVSGN